MKLKSIYKYLIWQQGKSYLIYFGIIFVIVHLGLLLTLSIDTNGSFGGMEMGTVIFMMISGIVFYRESLALSMQNGISRKTFFMALILGFITISVLAAAGDSIINIIGTEKRAGGSGSLHSLSTGVTVCVPMKGNRTTSGLFCAHF